MVVIGLADSVVVTSGLSVLMSVSGVIVVVRSSSLLKGRVEVLSKSDRDLERTKSDTENFRRGSSVVGGNVTSFGSDVLSSVVKGSSVSVLNSIKSSVTDSCCRSLNELFASEELADD